jgi:hypothetical protein
VIKQCKLHQHLNRFQTTSWTFKNTNFINKICLKTPIINNTLPSLFYKNVQTTRNKHVYYKTPTQTFTFLTQDIHFDTSPFILNYELFQVKWMAFITNYHFKKHISKTIWKKLCHIEWFLKIVWVECSMITQKSLSKSLIWVQYYNLKIGNKTKMENSCMNNSLH